MAAKATKIGGLSYMKRSLLFALMLVAILTFPTASFAAEDRVGFIDGQTALMAHPKYEPSQKHLNDFVMKKTEEAKQAAEKEPDADKRRIIIDDARKASGEEEMKIMNPITADINKVIEQVAKAKGVTVVLNKMLIYFGGVDITDDVVKALKELKF